MQRVISKWRSTREGKPIRLIVIHGDAGKSDAGTVDWITNKKHTAGVSYHYLVGRDGEVYQFVDEAEKAWHAGISSWEDCTHNKSVNAYSVGVSFANDGKAEQYRPVQYEAGAKLVAQIMARHGIPLQQVVGHADVSPGRKSDPWKTFDWSHFRELLSQRGVA